MRLLLLCALVLLGCSTAARADAPGYRWRSTAVPAESRLEARIPPPEGFRRIPVAESSFAAWLRGLPMKPKGALVMLHNGLPKIWFAGYVGVIDIDVGKKDLQQCADAVMRLRAEYLLAAGAVDRIAFDYTNGARVDFTRWAKGMRPKPVGSKVTWSKRGKADASYASFRSYMDQIFTFAGTASLARELKPVPLADMAIGDVFIKGGFPGHAVLVVDMAENPATGERRFLISQSYMPAQDIHVLKDPSAADGSPWYRIVPGAELVTPEWTFPADSLRRWP